MDRGTALQLAAPTDFCSAHSPQWEVKAASIRYRALKLQKGPTSFPGKLSFMFTFPNIQDCSNHVPTWIFEQGFQASLPGAGFLALYPTSCPVPAQSVPAPGMVHLQVLPRCSENVGHDTQTHNGRPVAQKLRVLQVSTKTQPLKCH